MKMNEINSDFTEAIAASHQPGWVIRPFPNLLSPSLQEIKNKKISKSHTLYTQQLLTHTTNTRITKLTNTWKTISFSKTYSVWLLSGSHLMLQLTIPITYPTITYPDLLITHHHVVVSRCASKTQAKASAS